MVLENKIAIVIENNLLDWQKLNVTSFLASSVAIKFPETHGKPFVNASNSQYLPFFKHPIYIYKSNGQQEINRAYNRAIDRELSIGIYTKPLFATKNEEQNHIEISKYSDENQELVGIVLFGEKRKVNKALDGLKFHH